VVYSACRNEYQNQKEKFEGSRAWPACKADCLDNVGSSLSISQPYRPPQPVTGITLLFISQYRVEVSGENMRGKKKRSVGRSVGKML
jgi:hypothetical protein